MRVYRNGVFLLLISLLFTTVICDARIRTRKKTGNSAYGLAELVDQVSDALGEFGGPVKTITDDISSTFRMMKSTADMMSSFADAEVVDGLNRLIRSLITELVRVFSDTTIVSEKTTTLTPSDFSKFIHKYKDAVISGARTNTNLHPSVAGIVTEHFPVFTDAVSELYSNVYSATGFGVPRSILVNSIMFLSFLETHTFITKESIEHFAHLPNEVLNSLEAMISEYINPDQISTMVMLLKIVLNNLPKSSFGVHKSVHDDL